MSEDVRAVLREYLAASPLLRDPGSLTDSTPLAAYGILDSVAVMDLVLFLETRFGVEFSARDLDRRRLETIERIEGLVLEKLAQRDSSQGGTGA
jgi:acyl carrier protein